MSSPDVDLLRRTIESLRRELLTVYEELAVLHSLGARIGRLADEDRIAAVGLQEALEITQADCGWAVLWEHEESRVPPGCRIGIDSGTVDEIVHSVLEQFFFKNKTHILSHAFRDEWRIQRADCPGRFLGCALSTGETSLGYLCLGRSQDRPIFTSSDQKLICAVAGMIAVALENVRLQRSELQKMHLENELDLARSVQRSLLPGDLAACDFLETAGTSIPCYEVGGDYFDLLSLNANECLVAIADVSGKGAPAALEAAMLQGVVHAAAQHTSELPALMKTVNQCLQRRLLLGSYATVFVGVLDREGFLRYSNGGHNPPLWVQSDGTVTQLAEGGPLVGILKDTAYPQGTIRMAPGDLLVLYTDGITEAENPQAQTWGSMRLLQWAGRQAGRSAADVEQSMIAEVTRFCAGPRQADDFTVLVVKYRGTGPQQE